MIVQHVLVVAAALFLFATFTIFINEFYSLLMFIVF